MNQEILKALSVVCEVTGTDLSTSAIEAMITKLEDHGEKNVIRALDRCMEEVKYRLTLADILERLPNKTPGVEEAWGMALKARLWDEGATCVVPRAVFEAFPFDVWPDAIAARMAFKERYPALAKNYGHEMKISLGWDREGRDIAVQEAVEMGLLRSTQAIDALPSREGST